jgi:hypothetical protein
MSDEDRNTLMGPDEVVVVKVLDSGDDETFTANGKEIRKSIVGSDTFNFMKAQQIEIEKANTLATVEKDKRELQDFTKQAELQYPHLPGESVKKGLVMKTLSTMTADARDTLSAMLKAGDEAMKSANLFKEVGADGVPTNDSPLSKLLKMSEEKAKVDKTTQEVAYAALLATPEGVALYDQAMASNKK